ncbi:MAG: flagellar motor protein MotB [Woeseia sp.]
MSEPAKKAEAGGVPAWVMTFADLMTLLMCFFVLLLSFSEMDVAKFKQLSGSMKNAFGVQAEIEAKSIPKGTSVVAQEFSPGRPDPTALPVVRQFTIDSNKSTLEILDREKELRDDMEKQAKRLRAALEQEIKNGSVSIETEGMRIIIRILEKASFDSGSADLRQDFSHVLMKIGGMIDNNSGLIRVSGHTDDVPISRTNTQFRSNWELSSSRAVSVTHELLKTSKAEPGRFTVTGHADTKPRADNLNDDNRAKNRRVDISIIRGEDDPATETSVFNSAPAARALPVGQLGPDAGANEDSSND